MKDLISRMLKQSEEREVRFSGHQCCRPSVRFMLCIRRQETQRHLKRTRRKKKTRRKTKKRQKTRMTTSGHVRCRSLKLNHLALLVRSVDLLQFDDLCQFSEQNIDEGKDGEKQ